MQHVCSLGTLCQSSQNFKRYGFKKESYPFDWIFSKPSIIRHCIIDDFILFLDRTLYTTRDGNLGGHNYYDSNMFNHHNPNKNNEHYSYFQRCVERFRKLLKSPANKLFYIFYANNSASNYETIKNDIIELDAVLQTKTTNHKIFVVIHVHSNKRSVTISDHENIRIVILNTITHSNGMSFHTAEDDNLLERTLTESYQFDIKPL